MESKSDNPPLVVVVGETASGKSALGLKLAEKFNGEIICADSWTVRRQVDIGTAKPSAEERQRVPHHLLDVVEPCADFTAAVFQELAHQAIDDIASRGKLPIMVGGTGLYVDGVIFNFSFLPEAGKALREELNKLSHKDLLERVRQAGLDLSGIDTRNKRRLMRLLETSGARPTRQSLRSNTLILGLQLPREKLRERIIARVEQMLRDGLEGEVQALAQEYGWQCEALKGIGYREWQGYFEGNQTLEETKLKIIKSTTELAKRQRTWFRRNDSIYWISNTSNYVDMVTTFLNKKLQ